MQTHTLLFSLVGLLSCISGLNAACRGCLDLQNRCRGNGATWLDRRGGEYEFTYRCTFVYRHGRNTEFHSEVIDAVCIVNGRVMRSGQEWFDQRRCADLRCVKSGHTQRMRVNKQVISAGCRTGSSCRRNGERWYENCSQYLCVVQGNIWNKRHVGRNPRCRGKKRQNSFYG